ncbi:hypothetical protein MTO96_019259 [Rhipicephalus appendiculatus]
MSFAENRFNSDSRILHLSGCLPPSHREDRLPERQSRWAYTVLTATLTTTASLLELTSLLGRSLFGSPTAEHLQRRSLLHPETAVAGQGVIAAHRLPRLVSASADTRSPSSAVRAHAPPARGTSALHLLVVTAFFTTRWYVFLTWVHESIPAFLSASLSIATALAAAAVTAWDSAPGILAKCFAEVFVQYLRAENVALAAAARGQAVVVGAEQRRDDLRTVLSDCRANVEAVLRLVKDAQSLSGTPLLLSFGANMGVVCAVLYSLTDSSTPTGLIMSGILYSSLNFADALDVASASESLANEVAEMKWTLRSLPFQGHLDEFAKEMSAAVITYTVILIQTSQGVKGQHRQTARSRQG